MYTLPWPLKRRLEHKHQSQVPARERLIVLLPSPAQVPRDTRRQAPWKAGQRPFLSAPRCFRATSPQMYMASSSCIRCPMHNNKPHRPVQDQWLRHCTRPSRPLYSTGTGRRQMRPLLRILLKSPLCSANDHTERRWSSNSGSIHLSYRSHSHRHRCSNMALDLPLTLYRASCSLQTLPLKTSAPPICSALGQLAATSPVVSISKLSFLVHKVCSRQ